MDRSNFLFSLVALAGGSTALAGVTTQWKKVAGVDVPDSPLAKEATAVAQACEPIEIFNHSLRTYLFAELIAQAQGIAHDPELVYVASILHDTGLTAAYMSDSNPFEVDGANVVKDLLGKHGIPEAKAFLAWDAVALHDNSGIAQHKQPEVQLVSAGVGADFGGYASLLSSDQIKAVFAAAPRKDFITVFLDAAAVVAQKKPLATAHSFVADVGYCKVRGFHLPSFCDEVKPDPYAGF
jgi:hypothetical protein